MRPKRLISLLVAVCMMITMLPLSAVTAFAEDTSSSPDPEEIVGDYKYAYKVNDGNATITKFLGPVNPTNNGPYDITIPTTLGGLPVTGLGKNSFAVDSFDGYEGNQLCSKIQSVTILQNVKSIGYRAFHNCDGLESLTINDAATSIGYSAFAGCTSLTTLKLGEKIKTIGEDAFRGCSSLTEVTIPQSVTSIGVSAFQSCGLQSLIIKDATTSIGNAAFEFCSSLTTLKLGENITTIGENAFQECTALTEVTIPQNVTSIGDQAFTSCKKLDSLTIKDAATSIGRSAFAECTSLTTLSLGENITTIGNNAFWGCSALTSVTIPKKVTTIESNTFKNCSKLEYIILPAGLTSFQDSLKGCPAECVIYYNNDKDTARRWFGEDAVGDNAVLAGHKLLYLCKVTFDVNGGSLPGYDKVPVYRTEKITDTKANDLTAIHDPTRAGYKFTGWYTTPDGKPEDGKFDVKETAITKDITLYARWEFDPNAPGYRPLTVTGGTVTVKYDGSDVTSKLRSTDATTGQKTYYVPDGAEVTVTLDKNLIPKDNVFDGWSTTGNLSLLTGQDYKAENITFRMSSDVNVSAKYRDAATDHTHDTTVCHPLTVTGGIVTVKNGDKDVTDTLTVTTDETTGKKTYYVPDGATVTVTLDKTLIPEGMVFDIWSTGKFSLPLGQDYKAETITFTMNTMSSDADIAAQYRDASIEDDGPGVLGTAAIIGTAAVGTAVLGYQAYSLGAEFAGKLMALPYFPSNRSALAMMLWEDAGKPMPESELLYPDVEQEEQDMDLQHAARWAMENELIPDLNDEGTAPEEMKFFPANPVSKLDVLNAWQKAQELKNN